MHTDRRRAESFGAAAEAYDRYRPRYPQAFIDELVSSGHPQVLDVGAGTGIASAQLIAAGAQVTAVEPDIRMAQLATAKGIDVEVAPYEDWQPDGRSFDLVLFAQSFHWVQPTAALEKTAGILRPGGRLVLAWNRIEPKAPTRQDLDAVYADYMDPSVRAAIHPDQDTVGPMVEQAGYRVERRTFAEQLRFSTQAYLDMAFTYSNHLTLDAHKRTELRARLEQLIGAGGVTAENNALALVCTPAR
ncbi:MAG: class I SAM-dependent methyltransferase [Mycobacterium sp.]